MVRGWKIIYNFTNYSYLIKLTLMALNIKWIDVINKYKFTMLRNKY